MRVIDQAFSDRWALYNGDSVEVLPDLPAASMDFSIFSPPFSSVYSYTPTERDLGNCRNDTEFFEHFSYITRELVRVMKPGRIVAVHVQNLPTYQTRDGVTGRRDFRGMTIRHFQEHGFVYQSEICVNKNPQTQAIRNHPKGLLFVQLERDASWMWQAYADYVCIFRTPGLNQVPVKSDLTHQEWINWAQPVWNDIREMDILPHAGSKDNDDERHLCALQLPVIERCVRLWSQKGETVLSPFAGIGSEGYQSLLSGRRFVGVELKPSYYRVAVKNLYHAEDLMRSGDLFSHAGVTVTNNGVTIDGAAR